MVHVVASEHARRRRRGAVVVLLAAFPLVAGGYYFGYNVGNVTIAVTDDAISQFRSLNITFSEVQLHSAGALTGSDWTSLKIPARTIDLKLLSDNLTSVLGTDKVPAGKYSQLRLVVDAAYGVLLDGTFVDVRVPSGELKTETPFELRPQGALSLLVRLEVVETANTYSLRPAFGGVTEV